MNTTYALECQVHFICEKRTKLYKQYYLGVSQLKNVSGTKSARSGRALPELDWGGA